VAATLAGRALAPPMHRLDPAALPWLALVAPLAVVVAWTPPGFVELPAAGAARVLGRVYPCPGGAIPVAVRWVMRRWLPESSRIAQSMP